MLIVSCCFAERLGMVDMAGTVNRTRVKELIMKHWNAHTNNWFKPQTVRDSFLNNTLPTCATWNGCLMNYCKLE